MREALAWLDERDPAAARRLAEAFDAAAAHIGAFPRSGAPRPDLRPNGVRLWVIRPFGYVAIYEGAGLARPRILRLLHGARDLSAVLDDPA